MVRIVNSSCAHPSGCGPGCPCECHRAAQPEQQVDDPQITVRVRDPAQQQLLALQWFRVADNLFHRFYEKYREYQVARIRRIWGRLGNMLKRHPWVIAFRTKHFVAKYTWALVKRWSPKGSGTGCFAALSSASN